MSVISVQGLQSLKGEIKVQGSKNTVLPMMAAAILHKGTTVIYNVPGIQDVFCMLGILESIGCRCSLLDHCLTIDASVITQTEIPAQYVKSMRSSIIVSGPLLGRMGSAVTSFPGGCSIGRRPIDLHLTGLRALGVNIEEEGECLRATVSRVTGAAVHFLFPSVGATENTILAAVLADGVTVIYGAAREPEILELCHFLCNMGADIKGAGTSEITIVGVNSLHDSVYTVAGDRIVAGTYVTAVMAAGGEAVLDGVKAEHLLEVLSCARRMGAHIAREENRIIARMKERPDGYSIATGPYPDFPTDMQSPMMAVMAMARGESSLEENVFEARFGTANELHKMGADIIIEGNKAVIHGIYPLRAGTVAAGDLRGGAALVVAALAADGETVIKECRHIERGYEDICRDLRGLGALIRGME